MEIMLYSTLHRQKVSKLKLFSHETGGAKAAARQVQVSLAYGVLLLQVGTNLVKN